MSHLTPDATWQALIHYYGGDYPNLVHMISVLLLVPGRPTMNVHDISDSLPPIHCICNILYSHLPAQQKNASVVLFCIFLYIGDEHYIHEQ